MHGSLDFIITDADCICISVAIICICDSVYVCLSVRTIKPKCLKLKHQTWHRDDHDTSPTD